MDAFTPAQTTELLSRTAVKKANMRPDKIFINAVMAGPLLSFGCALSLSTQTAPWFQQNAPGLIRTIGAFFFPVGLTMIVLTGADLCTSSFAMMPLALIQRKISLLQLLQHWALTFFGNLAGALFFMAIITGYGGTFSTAPYSTEAIMFANTKAVTPMWHQIFLRGIGCNWLVCLAIWQATQAREVVSKVYACWLPIMTFVGLGFDHVVANMFFIPLAIFVGAPEPLTVGYYIWKSMIPSLIGNIVGGALFVGSVYWYLHLTGTGPAGVKIHFDQVGQPEILDATSDARIPNSSGEARSGLANDLAKHEFPERKHSDSTQA